MRKLETTVVSVHTGVWRRFLVISRACAGPRETGCGWLAEEARGERDAGATDARAGAAHDQLLR